MTMENQDLPDKPSGSTGFAPSTGSGVASRWRRLADSWLKAVEKLDPLDPLACAARTRAQAYRDCANEIEAEIVPLALLRRADDALADYGLGRFGSPIRSEIYEILRRADLPNDERTDREQDQRKQGE